MTVEKSIAEFPAKNLSDRKTKLLQLAFWKLGLGENEVRLRQVGVEDELVTLFTLQRANPRLSFSIVGDPG